MAEAEADRAMREIGRRLRLVRQQRGMSQETLSEKSGLSVVSISRLESGKQSPRLNNLFALADALAVSLAYITDYDGDYARELKGEDEAGGPIHRIVERLQVSSREEQLAVEVVANAVLGNGQNLPVIREGRCGACGQVLEVRGGR